MEKLDDNQKNQGNTTENNTNTQEDLPFESTLFPVSNIKFNNINEINLLVQKELITKAKERFDSVG